MTPIIKQCLDRLDTALETIDEEGMIKMRAESAVMIRSWLEFLYREAESNRENTKERENET
jgi:hypothetical protein